MSALALLLLGCPGPQAVEPTRLEAPPVEVREAPPTPPATPLLPLPHPSCQGASVDQAVARLLTPVGVQGLQAPLPAHALAGLPAGEILDFPKAPANAAATVERASWRLAELLGPRQGLVPGGATESDPALHQGIRVRSVRKTRRQGPPMLVVVGDREDQLVIALMDKEASEVLASDVITGPAPAWERAGATPLWDLDGDGSRELVLWADAQQHYLRRGYAVVEEARLDLVPVMDMAGPLSDCP